MVGRKFGTATVDLVFGNIVNERTDAIVNAANTTLLGGGGVDGAIHRAGGPSILAECREHGGCATGEAKLTRGGHLAARFVIHAVGPIYRDGDQGEGALLASAYRRSLEIAVSQGLRSVAFPSISTGAYGYPLRDAAGIALGTVGEFLERPDHGLALVRFVLFSEGDLALYADVLEHL